MRRWVTGPLPAEVERALERLERTEGVVAIAVMPDVHLAKEVCVGTVTATRGRVIPSAVGGDIGCGMCALGFDVEAESVRDPRVAARVLDALYATVPILRHPKRDAPTLPDDLEARGLSAPGLEAQKRREARAQLGTLGRGNHFVELQGDDEGRLWAMVHSGSRGLGPAIRDHHDARAAPDPHTQLRSLGARDAAAYLADAAWARDYARANRATILTRVVEAVADAIGAAPIPEELIDADHNHVQLEEHLSEPLFVHRKGAQRAELDEPGIIPGSMGSASYHVRGRGIDAALRSSSHGAGRAMSRSEARQRISRARLLGETEGVFFDRRLSERLREEAPGAYKEIGAVMRAQRELVRITRRLRPLLVYKGG